MNEDKNKDNLKNEDKSETMNVGNKVPNIHPTRPLDADDDEFQSDEHEQAGRGTGNEPKSGGRQGGKSVEDGGQDVGSSSGSH